VAEIVDGNNLMGRLGGGSRDSLVTELADLARAKKKSLTVVFDGPPPPGRPKVQHLGVVTVVFAAPRSADDEIVRRIRETRDPRGVTVVTDDRGLVSAVKGAGARTIGVAVFRGEATSHLSRQKPEEGRGGDVPVNAREWADWLSNPRNRLQ
jgi:predicted RNA-binding protein with PIN domain